MNVSRADVPFLAHHLETPLIEHVPFVATG